MYTIVTGSYLFCSDPYLIQSVVRYREQSVATPGLTPLPRFDFRLGLKLLVTCDRAVVLALVSISLLMAEKVVNEIQMQLQRVRPLSYRADLCIWRAPINTQANIYSQKYFSVKVLVFPGRSILPSFITSKIV